MKLINKYAISVWACEECEKGNNTKEIRSLITDSYCAYYYCRYIKNDPEIRKNITHKRHLELLESTRKRNKNESNK